MPSISTQSALQKKLRKLYNDRHNRSFISEKNVICQDRKLRGRILKPIIEGTRTKRISKRRKKKVDLNLSIVDESKLIEVPEAVQNIVCGDVKLDVIVAHSNPQSNDLDVIVAHSNPQSVLLYRAIQRLWHENLQIFIYHGDSSEFANFIQLFPDLVAVQIKIVIPSSSELGAYRILSMKSFIFQKNAFLKMVETTRLDTSTCNIMFMLRGPNNEEPRAIRLSPKRTEFNMDLNQSSGQNGTTNIIINEIEQPKPLDLRTTTYQGLDPNNIINRNIVNKLQRLNTVIRRLPDKTSGFGSLASRKYCLNYRSNKCPPQFYSRPTNFLSGKFIKHNKARLVDVIERPPEYRNWQHDYTFNGKSFEYGDLYKPPVINLKSSSLIHNDNDPRIEIINMKTDMWMSYTSAIESFDRVVSLAELDTMPIEGIFNPVDDFNLADYL